MRKRYALGPAGGPGGVQHHRDLALAGHDGLERAAVEQRLERRAELDDREVGGHGRPALGVAQHELHARVAHHEIDRVARELVVHGHGHEAGAHDPEIGNQELGAVGRQEGHRVAADKAALEQAPRAGIRQGIDFAVGVFARVRPVEAVDQRELGGVFVAIQKIAEVGQHGGGKIAEKGACVRLRSEPIAGGRPPVCTGQGWRRVPRAALRPPGG